MKKEDMQKRLQAAEADLQRRQRNNAEAKTYRPQYEQYAFHREHVRRSATVLDLIRLALMNPTLPTKRSKKNTRMIYGNAALLLEAIRGAVSTGA